MEKRIALFSLSLFIIPVITLLICHQIVAHYYNFHTIPFIDGKASISMIGRGEKTILIFRTGFLFYALISLIFYLKISNFFLLNEISNKFKFYGISANLFLCIYILALGKDGSFFETTRRLAIILYITNLYINHIYLIKILKIFKLRKKILFNKIYLGIFYIIISIMTILIIIGLPWVNPLFKYPNQLKNIIEWNFFLLAVIYYLPLAFLFNRLKK